MRRRVATLPAVLFLTLAGLPLGEPARPSVATVPQSHAVWLGVYLVAHASSAARAQAPADYKPMSITLEDLPYPHPVSFLPLTMYGQDVRMAYMDVPPAGPANGRAVVLLHGMIFGEYWAGTIDVLRNEGFRVVVPHQIGFGRSSKPIVPYTLHDMAANTRKLLQVEA